MELCHAIAFIDRDSPLPAALRSAGLVESYRRHHPGQGTSNVCFCFDNAFLELLWLDDAAEASNPGAARLGVVARARWRESGALPFGVAIRCASDAELPPFPTWDYYPEYLPTGSSIPVAIDSDDERQPLLFRSPGRTRPDAWVGERPVTRQRAAGFSEIASVTLHLTASTRVACALAAVVEHGIAAIGTTAPVPSMVLGLRRIGGGVSKLSLPGGAWSAGADQDAVA